MTPTAHPTNSRCKRCGEPLPRMWLESAITPGEVVADRWCSDHCYAVELKEQSVRLVRAQRMGREAQNNTKGEE
jgi:hypothetical protein